MCGIAGIVHTEAQRPVSQTVLKRMCDTLTHRGPDDEGFFVKGNVGLGMRRLSIIDLAGGHQPISNEDGSIWIVFNGEIYNFKELRTELQARGHEFSTNTDTEAIVHAYEEYGDECVKKLNGMFGFAMWDGRNQKLFLARDRLGIKPLYYYFDDQCLVFGSELKAVLEYEEVKRELDYEALDSYLTFEYIPAPASIFKDIKKLPQGHTLSLQNGKVSISQYWDIKYSRVDGSEQELGEQLYDLLKDSVRMRLISDVPLGAFLSGGIDSSTIVCMMSEIMDRPVKTFSIGFDDPSYNELEYARAVARHYGTEHYEEIIKPNVVEMVENLVGYLDEPMADVSIFPTYLVSKLAREQVTVVLSGDGGDELFAGYDWYVADRMDRRYRKVPGLIRNQVMPRIMQRVPPSSQKKGIVNKMKRFVEGSVVEPRLQHFRWNTFLTDETRASLFSHDVKTSLNGYNSHNTFINYIEQHQQADPLWRSQFADTKTWMVDDILTKVDRMSMAVSLEARVPFLDHRVVEFAAGVPSEMKLKGSTTKYLLKKTMESRLPPDVLTRRKEGFSIPIKNWLKDELRPMMDEALSPERIGQDGLFNAEYIEKLKAQHIKGTANHSHQLWPLMLFEIWKEKYFRR